MMLSRDTVPGSAFHVGLPGLSVRRAIEPAVASRSRSSRVSCLQETLRLQWKRAVWGCPVRAAATRASLCRLYNVEHIICVPGIMYGRQRHVTIQLSHLCCVPCFGLDLGVLLGLPQLERAKQWREDPVSAPFNPLQPASLWSSPSPHPSLVSFLSPCSSYTLLPSLDCHLQP